LPILLTPTLQFRAQGAPEAGIQRTPTFDHHQQTHAEKSQAVEEINQADWGNAYRDASPIPGGLLLAATYARATGTTENVARVGAPSALMAINCFGLLTSLLAAWGMALTRHATGVPPAALPIEHTSHQAEEE
jgi:hypothetical protein